MRQQVQEPIPGHRGGMQELIYCTTRAVRNFGEFISVRLGTVGSES